MAERRNMGRGNCRVCGDEYNLTSNGRIRSHGPRDDRCEGGSYLPVGVEATTREDVAEAIGPTNADAARNSTVNADRDAMSAGIDVSEHGAGMPQWAVDQETADIRTAENGTTMTVLGTAGPNPHRAPLTPEQTSTGVPMVGDLITPEHWANAKANGARPGDILTVALASPPTRYMAERHERIKSGAEAGQTPTPRNTGAVMEAIKEISRMEAQGELFDPTLPPIEALAARLAPFTVIPDPVAFTTAVPTSATPTVRGGETLRPGPEKSDFDQWGRYKMPDPATGAVAGRQRVTTFAKMISDQWGLSQWQQRVLLTGCGDNPQLAALAAGKDAKGDKAFLDGLSDTIKDAAGSKAAAAHGTMMHTYTEKADMGLLSDAELQSLPGQVVRDLAAYTESITGAGLVVIPEMVERTTMVRSLDVTGTLDRIFRLPNGDHVIGDVKTGQDLSYGWLDIGVQLACYAYGVNENGVFDWGTRAWIPAPKVRTDFAIVMHMPAGRGTCTLYRVDLEKGWANCALARSVRDARKVRNHAEVLDLSALPAWDHGGPLDNPVDDVPAAIVAPVTAPLTVQPHSESFGSQPAPEQVPDPREKARKAMYAVQDKAQAAQVYAFASEVWPADATFLAELVEIGRTAIIPF